MDKDESLLWDILAALRDAKCECGDAFTKKRISEAIEGCIELLEPYRRKNG